MVVKYFLILSCLALLLGCEIKQPLKTIQTDNQQFQVHLLFEIDGCKVYRFNDGRTVWFSSCEGKTQEIHDETCGKGCTQTIETNAITRKKK